MQVFDLGTVIVKMQQKGRQFIFGDRLPMSMTRRNALKSIGCALSAFGSSSLPLGSEEKPMESTLAQGAGTVFSTSKSILTVPRSSILRGIEWLSEAVPYPEPDKRGDTFPVTWAADDNIYTSAGDPVWPDKDSGLDVECLTGPAPAYRVERVNPMRAYSGWGGCGPKPTGFISVKGILYLAFQNMTGSSALAPNPLEIMTTYGHGYDAQIVQSRDFGKTWEPDLKTISKPMFPGRKFAAPAFINYGKDNEGAAEFAYAISGEGWDNGTHLRLGRVPAADIMNAGSWEWVSGMSTDKRPNWSKSLEDAAPVLTDPGYLGYVDMTYIRAINRYLVLSWHHKVKCNPDTGSELIVYDSPEPWGPFTLVHHEDPWESAELNPYNPRLPLKWFDQTKLEGWMLFSGSWRLGGKTPHYRSHVKHFRLLTI